MKNRCSRKAFRLVRHSLWASVLGVCPFPLQIHLPPCPHPAQRPQRQTLWTTSMGSLAPWLQLQGAQEDVGEKEESEVRELVSGTPSCGVTAHVGQLWPQASHNCSLLSQHRPQLSQPWQLHCPCGFPRALPHFYKVFFIGLSSNYLHLNVSSLSAGNCYPVCPRPFCAQT